MAYWDDAHACHINYGRRLLAHVRAHSWQCRDRDKEQSHLSHRSPPRCEKADIFDKYNRFAEFWMLNAYSLQTTFFVTFGRIFDTHRDVYSVHKVVEDKIANPSIVLEVGIARSEAKSVTNLRR